ncbi:inositol monophosphatase family protein [Labrenzia sp. 011]|uniref:inositol monophosphatase family protein n=1 Tax=Labrenzia sp. 011 TaxID=2171494 RepID=UPI001403ECF1|nr:inositol monophosphatase family protein [Labrenzia sp. 011]
MQIDLEELQSILRSAGLLVTERGVAEVSNKSSLDYVTDIDLLVDHFLTEDLARFTPGIPVFSEERSMSRPQGAFWIIDPVDGTHNMIAGIPHYAVCAALFTDTCAVAAAVLDIASGDLFVAQKGQGAFLNQNRLSMPTKPSTLVGVSSGMTDRLVRFPECYKKLRQLGKIRNLGSQALHLCQVAIGRFGFTLSEEARFWDDAAGRLIAEEAGAVYRSFAASNEDDLMRLAFSKAPLQSVCSHPDFAEDLEALLGNVWSRSS